MVVSAIHYEVLLGISHILHKLPEMHKIRNRLSMFIVIVGAILGHFIEIWIFAFIFYFLCQNGNFGYLEGNLIYKESTTLFPQIIDYVYFSAVSYTSLGFGDILPVGLIRVLVALETLTGIVMLGWTTSFTFIQMQKFWGIEKNEEDVGDA